MEIFRAIRRFRGTVLIALVAAYAFFPAMKILQSYHDHAEPDTVTDVAATIIESPGHGTRVCNHHPQGCPNDCFCPSISPQTEDPITEGQLREPFLVQCTEEVAYLSGPFGVPSHKDLEATMDTGIPEPYPVWKERSSSRSL